MTSSKKRQGNHEDKSIRLAPDLRLLEKLRSKLESNPRDLLLFDLLTHSGFGLKRLLRLKVRDLFHLKTGDSLPILMREGEYFESIFSIKTHTGMLNGMKCSDPEEVVAHLKTDLATAARVLMGMFDRLRSSQQPNEEVR